MLFAATGVNQKIQPPGGPDTLSGVNVNLGMVLKKPTAPVSSQDVYEALCGAASQDPATLQTSSKLLHDYLARPSTYDHLYTIAAERNTITLDVRRMAIIQFKNGVVGAWKSKRRARSVSVILGMMFADIPIWVARLFDDTMKAGIRALSMSFLHEEDNTVSTHVLSRL